MTYAQLNSGTAGVSGSFTVTLPSPVASGNRVVIVVAGNTYTNTPSGFTLRTSQENFMGHYLFDKDGASDNSWGLTNTVNGRVTWVAMEVTGGTYDIASSSNNSAQGSTYATPTLTPTAGNRLLIASLGSVAGNGATRTVSGWTNSFTEIADLGSLGDDYPAQALAVRDNLTTNGSTGYTTTGTFSYNLAEGRTAIIGSYITTSGGAPAIPPLLIMQTRRPY